MSTVEGEPAGTTAKMFTDFAEHEFRLSSPVYTALARGCAARPALAAPLAAAPPTQRRALLYFAAAQYLLRTAAAGHPLTAYLPSLGGVRPVDDDLLPSFADLVTTHGDALAALCATRTTQTNEAARAALLWPAFCLTAAIFRDRPVTLIELGTSAGLLLLPDRYGYRYIGADTTIHRYGRPDAPAPLTMSCALEAAPLPTGLEAPTIVDRIGVDLHPVAPDDTDAVAWLRSCIWPEQVDRLARLDAALAEMATMSAAAGPDDCGPGATGGIRLVQGDLVDTLPGLLGGVDPDAVPVIFASHALTYLPPDRQAALVGLLAGVGAARDLAMVVIGDNATGVDLFAAAPVPPRPDPRRHGHAATTLALATWRRGRASLTTLGETGPHGSWLRWAPRELSPGSFMIAA